MEFQNFSFNCIIIIIIINKHYYYHGELLKFISKSIWNKNFKISIKSIERVLEYIRENTVKDPYKGWKGSEKNYIYK